ncbi:MAG TPA: hypothetical protein VMB21_14270 [Candidatus Limnocylindria bacterium]|nr:hypothetical protein [Candidatus Limnocylindria bacterium]
MKFFPAPGLLLLLLGTLLVSCKRREPTTTTTTSPAAPAPAAAPVKPVVAHHPEDRLKETARKWFMTNLVGAYERLGQRDPKWDEPAKTALKLMAEARADRYAVDTDWQRDVSTLAQSALDQGCPDPLVRYAAVRYRVLNVKRSGAETAGELGEIARAMQGSSYSGFVRFYAEVRAAEALKATLPDQESHRPEMEQVHYLRRNALTSLIEALHDHTTPDTEIGTMCRLLLDLVRLNKQQFPEFWDRLDPVLQEQWPKSAQADLLRAWFYQTYAWQARGNGFADKVTPEGARFFEARMKRADQALQSAWRKDDTEVRIPVEMIEVCTALNKSRREMEEWFQRAMLLAPDSHEACFAKLHYLKPVWYGSPEEMLAFGRECVSNPKWSGNVRLILVDAHAYLSNYERKDKAARQAYWLQPGVWPDLRSAYEKFFAEPQFQSWRQNYALDAYRCQAWDDLNLQLPQLGAVDYKFFGGRAAFDRMVAEAKQHAKP